MLVRLICSGIAKISCQMKEFNSRKMSAVCFLFARNIQTLLAREGVTPPPIGLVDADWGGTTVEAWSPNSALHKCQSHFKKPKFNMVQHNDRSLWNAMVNSLKWNSVKGFLWYQGERNSQLSWHRDLYQCSFPALIKAWRQEFSKHSSTDPSAPWGFVQLGKYVESE